MNYDQLTKEMIDEAVGGGCHPNGNDVIAFNVFSLHVFGEMAAQIQRWRLPVDVVVIGSEVLKGMRSDRGPDMPIIESEFPERLYEGEIDRRDPGYDGTFVGTVFNIPLYKNLGSWRPDPEEVYFFTEEDFLFKGDGLNLRGVALAILIT
jgi:hypothetical protein